MADAALHPPLALILHLGIEQTQQRLGGRGAPLVETVQLLVEQLIDLRELQRL